MKKLNRFLSLLLIFSLLTIALASCGDGREKDVAAADLADAVGKAIGKTDMADPGESYVKGYMKHTAEELGDYAIRKTVVGTSIDEYGVFKAGKLSTAELKSMIEGYLKMLQDAWMNYQPEEKPKLDGAQITVQGSYVLFTILGDADQEAAVKAFKDALK